MPVSHRHLISDLLTKTLFKKQYHRSMNTDIWSRKLMWEMDYMDVICGLWSQVQKIIPFPQNKPWKKHHHHKSSCCLLGQSDGWLEVPHRGVTARHMGGSGRSLSPVEVHTHGSHKQLKRPGRCHLSGYHSTCAQTQTHSFTATSIQMIRLIVSYCLTCCVFISCLPLETAFGDWWL